MNLGRVLIAQHYLSCTAEGTAFIAGINQKSRGTSREGKTCVARGPIPCSSSFFLIKKSISYSYLFSMLPVVLQFARGEVRSSWCKHMFTQSLYFVTLHHLFLSLEMDRFFFPIPLSVQSEF